MAGEWRASTWGDEISLEYGKALRDYGVASGAYRVYGANGPIGWTSEPLTLGPGVVLGRKGAYRGVRYSSEPFFVIDTAYYVVPKTELDMRWLYYAIQHYKLGEVDDGSPIPSTTRAAVYMLDLDVPTLPEQRRIAHILGSLDDKIELNRRMSETLEAMARALFKSWFVDFDPVRAKMAGRDTGLPREIADLFPDRLVESELGEVPEGWRLASLAALAELNPESWSVGSRPDTTVYVDLASTKWGCIEATANYPRGAEPSRAQRVLRLGDTIVGTVRPGNGSYALISEGGLTGSTGFAVLRPGRLQDAAFVYLAATAAPNIEALQHLADGAAYPAVRPEVVARTAVWRPNEAVLDEFSRLAAPLLTRVGVVDQESRSLASLRDALLPGLISGDHRIDDAIRTAGCSA
jgi:type I restriction enzyme S subunit